MQLHLYFWPEHGDSWLLPMDICPVQHYSFKNLCSRAEAALHTAPHTNGQAFTCTHTHTCIHTHTVYQEQHVSML